MPDPSHDFVTEKDFSTSDDSSDFEDEFQDIEVALTAFAEAVELPYCTEDAIKPLFKVLDYRIAKRVAKRSFSEIHWDYVDTELLLSCLSKSSTQQKHIRAILRLNISSDDDEYSTYFYPDNFHDQAVYRFDGSYSRAQYVYPFGLGIVLQRGGPKTKPLKAALTMDKIGRYFNYSDSDEWRLVSLFATDTAEDGPLWPGYPTADEAKDWYNYHQELERTKRETEIAAAEAEAVVVEELVDVAAVDVVDAVVEQKKDEPSAAEAEDGEAPATPPSSNYQPVVQS